MDYNFLIQEFLDGELDSRQEQELFAALSSDSSLRNELKQAIDMDKGLSKRVSAFVPYSSTTMSIFSRLGIGTAAGVAAAGTILGLKDSIIAFFSSSLGTIVSTVVAIAVTAGSFLTFYNPPDTNINPMNNQKQSQQIQSDNKLPHQKGNNIPGVVAKSTDNNTNVKVDTVIKYITRTVVKNRNNDNSANFSDTRQQKEIETQVENTELAYNDIISPSEAQVESSQQLYLNKSNEISPLREQEYLFYPLTVNSSKLLNLSFEVKGNGYWNIPKADVPLYNAPAFANLQLSTLYAFNDKFSVGIDLRQESFYQKFIGTNELGESFEYKQYPNYYTFSVLGRYSFLKNSIYGIFTQASMGGTATGGVGRLMLGIELSPFSNISFLLGIEGGMLIYKHQNNIFSSPKLGLNYGVAFNF